MKLEIEKSEKRKKQCLKEQKIKKKDMTRKSNEERNVNGIESEKNFPKRKERKASEHKKGKSKMFLS